ncbi:MAG: hypothetical protein IID39_10160 [Planctomycetes bacterium]|nr:hypothetical protein [Planctomycetota bacterium]
MRHCQPDGGSRLELARQGPRAQGGIRVDIALDVVTGKVYWTLFTMASRILVRMRRNKAIG